VLLRRSEIELELGKSDQAVADANRALGLTQAAAEPGAFSDGVGHVYLALGRALQKQGKDEQGRARSARLRNS